ncbi:hypothetical protein JTB14_023700 [Gonioctena quinquepunctata]|nr:hypothetical protein JTB14_023700 [Gonioctena quinquepunctata]
MTETRKVATPMEINFQVKGEEPIINNVPYRRLICRLMYLSLVSRPDISYSIVYSTRFLDKPRKSTWEAGKRILRYLNHTKEYGSQLKKGNMQELMALCDADWGGDQETRKSVSGFVCFHAGNPIAWHSSKQTCVAQSSMEAEYISAGISTKRLELPPNRCTDSIFEWSNEHRSLHKCTGRFKNRVEITKTQSRTIWIEKCSKVLEHKIQPSHDKTEFQTF